MTESKLNAVMGNLPEELIDQIATECDSKTLRALSFINKTHQRLCDVQILNVPDDLWKRVMVDSKAGLEGMTGSTWYGYGFPERESAS
jgi:hypothetical protein